MRLKRLELLGFKSFADRTVFDFGDHTMTGIVGPNGCGKSNVVDAIRWILGEQRPTSMRGKEMTDVIFKGSTSRAKMSFAEGCVTLDNSCGTIERRGSEVEIKRIVFKSGEGEYLIDGEQVRLKDIREMLFDTGLGSRGYSVLEQGRIDAVLSSNPIDRRRIFEEAAGISRYRQRKHECELRLSRVQQDMERLEDVVRELDGRERSLKLQAGKARRYVEVRDKWRTLRTRHLEQLHHELSSDLGEVRGKMKEHEAGLDAMRVSRGEVEQEVGLREREEEALRAQLESAGTEVSRLEGDGREMDERRRQLAARAVELKASAEEETKRAIELAGEIQRRREELVVLGSERTELLAELAVIESKVAEEHEGARSATRNYREARTNAEEQNSVVLEALHARTEAQNTLGHQRKARDGVSERMQRSSARVEEARGTAREASDERERGEEQVREASARLAAAEEGVGHREAELAELEEATQAAERRRADLEVERAAAESRADALGDREEELEGLKEGHLLAAVEAERGPIGGSELKGLVADRIQTDTRYARALDAVLGDRARALLVENTDAVLKIVSWLRDEGEGSCSIALGSGIGTGSPRLYPDSAASRLGAIGALMDHVRVDSGYEELVRSLIGDVLLVESVEDGLSLLSREGEWRCVTPAGELVDSRGLIAGERALTQGLAGRRARIEELKTEIQRVDGELEALDGDLKSLEGRRVAVRGRADESATELEAARAGQAEATVAEQAATSRVGDAAEAIAHAERDHEQVAGETQGLEEGIRATEEALREASDTFERENQVLQTLEDERRTLEEERDKRARTQGAVEVERTRLAEASAGLERRALDLEKLIEDYVGEKTRVSKQSEEHEDVAKTSTEESAKIAEDSATLLAERAEADERLVELRSRNKAARTDLDSLREGRDAAVGDMEKATLQIGELRLNEQRHELARTEVLERAAEELDLDAGDLAKGFEAIEGLSGVPKKMKELEKEVRDLKRTLDRIGPVNTEALDELEGVADRLQFLKEQVADLTNGRRMLVDTIARIETESERLFLDTFNEVRENFQRIFRQMFGGGKADVRLAEGEPVLDAGVEIVARPPGREMLPIGLLSGGQRTMTALALLFSVFESRPSPFCVLDEVDAALDDANVQRFLAMLDTFRAGTQFVVVTHNKGTMAHAQRLYGVTMQTKGVSHQVAVDFSEVDDFVPDMTSSKTAKELPRIEEPPPVPEVPRLKEYEGDEHAPEQEEVSDAEDLDDDTGEPTVVLTPTAPAEDEGGDEEAGDGEVEESEVESGTPTD